jgi:hypothetical protein
MQTPAAQLFKLSALSSHKDLEGIQAQHNLAEEQILDGSINPGGMGRPGSHPESVLRLVFRKYLVQSYCCGTELSE